MTGIVAAGALGLLLWLCTQGLALGLAGAGHGWGDPLLFTLPLVFLYPAALIRGFESGRGRRWIDMLLLLTGLALDLLLVGRSLGEESVYFLRIWQFEPAAVAIWMILWAGWQAVLVVRVLRSVARPD